MQPGATRNENSQRLSTTTIAFPVNVSRNARSFAERDCTELCSKRTHFARCQIAWSQFLWLNGDKVYRVFLELELETHGQPAAFPNAVVGLRISKDDVSSLWDAAHQAKVAVVTRVEEDAGMGVCVFVCRDAVFDSVYE